MEEEKDVDRHSFIRSPFVDGCIYGNSVGDGREDLRESTHNKTHRESTDGQGSALFLLPPREKVAGTAFPCSPDEGK